MKKAFFIIALVFISLLSQAQQDSFRVMYSIGLGYQYTQFDGLSDQMQVKFGDNYNINSGSFAMNFGCYSIQKRFLFGGEFGILQHKAVDDALMSSVVSQAVGYFDFGYLVIDKPGFMAYPFLGVGAAFSGLALKNKTATDWVDPDYVIRADQRGNFSSIGGSFNAGVSLRKTCAKIHHGKQLQLGIDLGVHITPQKKYWTYDGSDEKVESIGTANNIGYYARITIGGLMTRVLDKSCMKK